MISGVYFALFLDTAGIFLFFHRGTWSARLCFAGVEILLSLLLRENRGFAVVLAINLCQIVQMKIPAINLCRVVYLRSVVYFDHLLDNAGISLILLLQRGN